MPDFVYVKNWSSYSSYGKVLTENPEWMITKENWEMPSLCTASQCEEMW